MWKIILFSLSTLSRKSHKAVVNASQALQRSQDDFTYRSLGGRCHQCDRDITRDIRRKQTGQPLCDAHASNMQLAETSLCSPIRSFLGHSLVTAPPVNFVASDFGGIVFTNTNTDRRRDRLPVVRFRLKFEKDLRFRFKGYIWKLIPLSHCTFESSSHTHTDFRLSDLLKNLLPNN